MMKNKMNILLAAVLALSAGHLSANGNDCCDTRCDETNKTTLTPRSHGVNLALEKTAGWSNLITRKDEKKYGGNLQAAFFMMGSKENAAIAKYFLFPSTATRTAGDCCVANCCDDDCASVVFPRDTLVVGENPGEVTAAVAQGFGNTVDLDLGLLVHNYDTSVANAAASRNTALTLCPEHTAIGAHFMYHQELHCLLKGLYFSLNVPVVHVKNKLRAETSGSDTVVFGTVTEKANLASYLSGNYEVALATEDAQAKLCFAKMNAEVCKTGCNTDCDNDCNRDCNPLSKTGVADLELMVGYQFLNTSKYHAAVNLGVTIPTGNKHHGTHVFEAIVGNGGHVGFGFGLDSDATLWKAEDQSLRALFAFNYRYLFQNDETRTLGLKGRNFGQYHLLIDRTVQPSAQQLTPAANVTTLRVDVTPGSQFDGILALNYNYCGFAFDLGYNLFFRERECVKLDCDPCSNVCEDTCNTGCKVQSWVEDKWAIATRNANMTVANATLPMVTATSPNLVIQNVNRADLDTCSAETPSLTTHKLYAGVAYTLQNCEVPVLFGLGGHYEWAKNDLVTNWGFNAKIGVGF